MKNLTLPILLGCLSVSFTYPSSPNNANARPASALFPATDIVSKPSTVASIYSTVASIYTTAKLEEHGLSIEAFEYAMKGYQHLLEKNKIANSRYLTICDFSQSSKQKRFYIVDLVDNELITNTYVAHGRNSGGEFATHFSNTPESLQSSLGFYITHQTYTGKHGLSLRLIGVDGKFNDKAYERTIVMHGAAYVDASRVHAGGYMGRSWGCPALPKNESSKIITTIKEGTCLFIYHPQKQYLAGSNLLND